ncbi:MAG: hypothetical protein RI955_206 [Bacteroidota bacterium]|jgi:hypothetical protein
MNRHLQIATLILGLVCCSCNNDKGNNANLTTNDSSTISSKQTSKVLGKKYFDYDEIVYYFNNIEEDKLSELYDNQSKTEIDSFKMGIILGDIPESVSDLVFIDKLEKVGYKKTLIDKSKFDEIDKIFIEKTTTDNIATSCIYVYRDILIFKKNSKVVGTAKVCFGCMANEIKGTEANTENFGQDGDYDKLWKLIRQ